LAKEAANPAPSPADMRRERLASQKIGLGVRPHVRHEVEQHETGEDERQLSRAGKQAGQPGQCETDGTAKKADDLQADAGG